MLIVSLFAAEPSALNEVVAIAFAPDVLRACTWGMEIVYCGAGVEHAESSQAVQRAKASGVVENRRLIKISS